MTESAAYQALQEELLGIIQSFNQRAWSLATSTNYSFRNPQPHQHTFTITSSGKDKENFQATDLMIVDTKGQGILGYEAMKPSAETLLHTLLYENEQVKAVLHTHSVAATVLSRRYLAEGQITLEGWEMLKALPKITTHASQVLIPIFENSQDMSGLSQEIRLYQEKHPEMCAFLLSGHGLYSWGEDLAAAKRQVEALEFLFECLCLSKSLGS